MISAKEFMEFFEKEYNVKFVDAKTGKHALDVLSENSKKSENTHDNSECKSDYDKFLEDCIEGNDLQNDDKGEFNE